MTKIKYNMSLPESIETILDLLVKNNALLNTILHFQVSLADKANDLSDDELQGILDAKFSFFQQELWNQILAKRDDFEIKDDEKDPL